MSDVPSAPLCGRGCACGARRARRWSGLVRPAALFAVLIGAALGGALAGPAHAQEMHAGTLTFLGVDAFEFAGGAHGRPVSFDGQAWIGDSVDRLWMRLDASGPTRGSGGSEAEVQLLYSRLVSSFWDFQVGVRADVGEGEDTRFHLAAGFEGLAPYWFEVTPFLFLSEEGDVSARLEASYDVFLTQRLIAEPEAELDGAFQDVSSQRIGAGITGVEWGIRLRYEVVREFAPYIGYEWERSVGETARLRRGAGLDTRDGSWVIGVRAWY